MKIEDIQLQGDRVLISPLEIYTYKTVQHVPDPEFTKGKSQQELMTTEQDVPMVEVEKEVKSDIQQAKVVAIGTSDYIQVKVGNIILYHIRTGVPVELVDNSVMIKHYDILAIVN